MKSDKHINRLIDGAGRLGDWATRGACAGSSDSEAWFLTASRLTPKDRRRRDMAAATCASCPVREQCLEYAIETHTVGMWGGHTFSESNHAGRDRVTHRPAIPTERDVRKRSTDASK